MKYKVVIEVTDRSETPMSINDIEEDILAIPWSGDNVEVEIKEIMGEN
jgi:hypothetical protein